MNDTALFWSMFEKRDNGCHEWVGSTTKKGYGRLRWNRKMVYAHRQAWILENGPLETGECVLHDCDNPPCGRLDHLFIGTKGDNSRDRTKKGRSAKGEKNAHAKLAQRDVDEIQRLISEGVSCSVISQQFPVGRSHISNIKHGRRWNDPRATTK